MHYLILFLVVFVSIVDYLTEPNKATGGGGWLPGAASYLAELSGAVILLYVVAVGVRHRFRNVRAIYWVLFGAIVFVAICGTIAGRVDPGAIFAGTRNYARAVPLFLLPAVYAFTEKQVRTQLLVLLSVAFIQLPLAIQQRIATRAMGEWTGDYTAGTLGLSSTMSMFLICGICIAGGLFLRGYLKPKAFLVIFLLLVAPTTINETKGTFFLLPLGLLVTFVAGAATGKRLKNLVVMTVLMTIFVGIFFTAYDYWAKDDPYPRMMREYLTNEDYFVSYMYYGESIGATKYAGRVDGLLVPLTEMAKDPVTLVMGLGVGNASTSALGPSFTGEYFSRFFPFIISSASRLILELGIAGLVLVYVLIGVIFLDSYRVARTDKGGFFGAVAAGWTGAVAVLAVGVAYKDIIMHTGLAYLFWYWSGLVVAHRMRLEHATKPLPLRTGQQRTGQSHAGVAGAPAIRESYRRDPVPYRKSR